MTMPMVELRRAVHRIKETSRSDLPLLSMSATNGVRLREESDGRAASEDRSSYLAVKVGDIVVNKLSARDGAFGRSSLEGIVSPAYWVLSADPEFDSRYLDYFLHSSPSISEIGRLSKFMPPAQYDVAWDDFARMLVPKPPLEEQRRIADFLDEQTARIDAVLKRYATQLALLDEAQICAYRELTEGGPDLPAWKVSQAFSTGSGTTPPTDAPGYFDGGIPWVNSGDLNDGPITQSARSVSESALRDLAALRLHRAGSLLIAMYGATVGKTGLLEMNATVNQAVCVLTPRGPVNAAYAQYWFVARRAEILSLASGSGQPNISQDVVRSLRLQLGDLNWQKAKLDQLRRTEYDTSLRRNSTRELMGLVEEYKLSMITAAVTGELDVTTARRGIPA